MALYQALIAGNVNELQQLYESRFAQLTETYYKAVDWPGDEEVRWMVGDLEPSKLEVFIVFYKELYFRQAYAMNVITLEERFGSYFNYCAMFNLLLNTAEPIAILLPDQWTRDIIDEFLYQFQPYSLFRLLAIAGKNEYEEECLRLKGNKEVYGSHQAITRVIVQL